MRDFVHSLFSLFWVAIFSVAVLACLVVGCVVLYKYGAAMRAVLLKQKGPADAVSGKEPAYKQYFFGQAWRDYRAVVRMSIQASREMFDSVLKAGNFAGRGCGIAGNAIILGSAGGVVAGALVLSLVGALHLLLVALMCAAAMTLALVSRVLEYAAMLWRRSQMVCPHAGCYRKIALPVYVCPGCGARHKRLIPGAYGTFHRRCQCKRRLPTLFLLGRHKLDSYCPHPGCGRPLNAAIGPLPTLHFPIVGGASSGKTSLLTAMLVELSAQAKDGRLSIEFPEKKDAALFTAASAAFAAGRTVAKTPKYSPNAFLATITDRLDHCALVYAYDAAGELYQGADELNAQEYYSYIQGVILVLDAFSLPEARQAGGADFFRVQHLVRPSSEPVESIYIRMVETLRSFSGQSGRLPQPLAVVLSKADALGLRDRLLHEAGSDDPSAQSAAVQRWLQQHGEGNLVRLIGRDFKQVRFFACSALGRLPAFSAEAFVPAGALAPLAWLLGHNGLRIGTEPAAKEADLTPPLLG